MADRVPAVIDGELDDSLPADFIDLNDPKWGGKGGAEDGGGGGDDEDVQPEMDEAWCRKRLWQIACLLRKETTKGAPNQLVISALSSEAAIVRGLLPKDSSAGRRAEELDDQQLEEQIRKLKSEGKL